MPQQANNSRGQSGRTQQPGTLARTANKPNQDLNDPYIRCIAGPTTMMSTAYGFPDGNAHRSIVVDFKQSFTITPVSGVVRYALISSPLGCFALSCGSIAASVAIPQYNNTTDQTYTWNATNPSRAAAETSWFVLPFSENASWLLNGETMGGYKIGEYRGLMYTADSMFTGSDNANGGVVRVVKTTVSPVITTGVTINTVSANRTSYTNLNNVFTDNAPGKFTTAAKDPLNLRSVNSKPVYFDTADGGHVGQEICPYGWNSAGVVTSALPWVGMDYTVPVTVVEYTGLDASASITVEVRSCLEMTPAPGTMAGFAKPSPPCNILTWQKVANFARSIPTAVVQGAGKAAYAYLTGGSAAAALALTGML